MMMEQACQVLMALMGGVQPEVPDRGGPEGKPLLEKVYDVAR